MEPDQIHTTEEEAYGMARTAALRTLSVLATDDNETTGNRIWAAEVILDNDPAIKKIEAERDKRD